MTEFFAGLFTGLIPIAAICTWLDRRADGRYRAQQRVDQIPVPLPGAYEPRAERALPGRRTHTVIDEES